MSYIASFAEKKVATSLQEVPTGSQLWLVRLPKRFPLEKFPSKFKIKRTKHSSKNGDSNDDTNGDSDESRGIISGSGSKSSASSPATQVVLVPDLAVGSRSYKLLMLDAAGTEGSDLHAVLGNGEDLEVAAPFVKQLSLVENVHIPTLAPQPDFKKARVPAFEGVVTLQGTPSGYGTALATHKGESRGAAGKIFGKLGKAAKPLKRSSPSAGQPHENPKGKKARLSSSAKVTGDQGNKEEGNKTTKKREKKDKKKKDKKKEKKKKKKKLKHKT